MAASDVWVACGAPLASGDGWRVWYSWPQGDFTPRPPGVRTPGGEPCTVIQGAWRPGAPPPGSERNMAVQELRIANATPGALYEVTLPETSHPFLWRTLPSELPAAGISFLIGSCFWLNDDKEGFYSAAVQELVQRERPLFKVLMGDQLYADVWAPLPHTLPKGAAHKYERYWGHTPYRDLLAACPTLVSCDDHEFWNDYPQKQLQVPLSWNLKNGDTLAALFDAYQAALNPGGTRWASLTIGPVGLFIADTRSHRTRDDDPHPRLMLEDQWEALEAWAKNLQGPGVLVLPQPLLKTGGSKTDRTLLDFQESGRLGAIFEHVVTGPGAHDILILTGDIHTGRLSRATIFGLGDRAIHEFVASPASRVTPYLPPWGQAASKLPAKATVNGRRWDILPDDRVPTTVDNNVGLIGIAPGRNGRTRFSLQLWRVRPYQTTVAKIFKRKPAKGAQPIHDPIELELR
jgi:hypothetical protein